MATYEEIYGKRVKDFDSDPTLDSSYEGQVWYNSATGTLKSVVAFDSWTSASSGITARDESASQAGSGTQNAAFAAGGINSSSSIVTSTENYNGSGWSAGANLPVGTWGAAGAGTTTASLVFGGVDTSPAYTAETFEGDGSSYSDGGALNTGRYQLSGVGTQTAGLAFAGGYPSNFGTTLTEEYNGSSWTAVNTMGTATYGQAGTGTSQTSAVSFGGGTFPPTVQINVTQEYDGTNWSAGENLPAHLSSASAAGSQTASLLFGGNKSNGTPPVSKTTETFKYDGTNFSAAPALSTAVNAQGSSGSQSAAVSFFGNDPSGRTSATEEFTSSINTITAAAWASGGTLNTARQRTGGFGAAQTSAVVAAGATAPPASALNKTEEYNGTSWTEGNNVGTARYNMTAFGTEPAGVLAGVGTPSVTYGGTTEEYNGSTWTTVNPYAAPGANYRSASGTLTAGLLVGGVAPYPAEMNNAVEEYDGTNWSNGNTTPQYQSSQNQAGSQTATINGGGNAGPAAPGPVSANTISLEYDGTNWTAGPNANLYSDRTSSFNGGSGTQTAAMFVGGDGVGTTTYDGTSFATAPTVAAARGDTSAAGQAPAAATVIFAGSPVPGVGGTTLEFTEATETVTAATLTTS